MPRSLEEIHRESPDSPALRGLVGVLNEKLQLRARYPLLEYEAGMEGRPECSELYRVMNRIESEQIARLSAALASELESEGLLAGSAHSHTTKAPRETRYAEGSWHDASQTEVAQ